jgi:acyl-CoA synthetase (AMP-forming)/AMP-acid ligase II
MLITAGAMFTDAGRRFATRPALGDGTSYRELDGIVGGVAGGLAALGLASGERVAVLSHNRPEVIALWLGLERAGLVRVVLHSHFDMALHADIVSRTGARGLVFDTRFAEALGAQLPDVDVLVGLGDDCPSWAMAFDELLEHGVAGLGPVDVDEDSPVCIQPTTGTTGAPKPWVVSHRAWHTLVAHNVMHLAGMAPVGEDEVNLHVHALQWASGAQTLLPYVLQGAQTVVVDDHAFDPVAVVAAIEESGATGLFLPGPMLAPVLDVIESRDRFEHRLRRLVLLFCPPELLERTTAVLGPAWCHGYGSTEQGAPVSRLLAREAPSRLPTVGRPASPLIEVTVLDLDGGRLPAGRVGELAVRSAMSSGRYWDDPALTEAAFAPGGWFRSGDLGILDEDGFLTYIDRSRDAISTSDGIVYPHEVEAAVLRHRSVAHCGAVGLGPEGAQEVVAAVVLKTGSTADPEKIAALAAEQLAPAAHPRVVVVTELPVVLGGAKVQREVLREQLLGARARSPECATGWSPAEPGRC